MAFGPLTPSVYMRGIDEYLAATTPDARVPFLEQQLRIIDSHDQALERWSRNGGHGNPPSPFTAFELATITNELAKRLVSARDDARATQAAE